MNTEDQSTTVYIVDDDASICRAMCRLMRSRGFHTVSCTCAEDLLKQAAFPKQACVIADICMTGISGLELPDRLAARHEHLPVIFVTAFDNDGAREQAKRVGAAGFFRKPVDDQALVDAIYWALDSGSAPAPTLDQSWKT